MEQCEQSYEIEEETEESAFEIDPNDIRLTDLLLGGVIGYELMDKEHQHSPYAMYPPQAQQQMPPQYAAASQHPMSQQMQQPRLPYPPNFIPNQHYEYPISNINQVAEYVNRYFYFWPSDDPNLGYWVFVTYIDGMGIRGYHFDGQHFNPVTLSPNQLKGFFIYS